MEDYIKFDGHVHLLDIFPGQGDPVLLQPLVKGGAADPQDEGRPGYVISGLLEGALDDLFFRLFQARTGEVFRGDPRPLKGREPKWAGSITGPFVRFTALSTTFSQFDFSSSGTRLDIRRAIRVGM